MRIKVSKEAEKKGTFTDDDYFVKYCVQGSEYFVI